MALRYWAPNRIPQRSFLRFRSAAFLVMGGGAVDFAGQAAACYSDIGKGETQGGKTVGWRCGGGFIRQPASGRDCERRIMTPSVATLGWRGKPAATRFPQATSPRPKPVARRLGSDEVRVLQRSSAALHLPLKYREPRPQENRKDRACLSPPKSGAACQRNTPATCRDTPIPAVGGFMILLGLQKDPVFAYYGVNGRYSA